METIELTKPIRRSKKAKEINTENNKEKKY